MLYAIWTKDPYLYIRTNGDTTMKTWQTEKETNYGLDSNLLIRQNNDTKSYGQFGEKFKNTSTSDGTDIKTSLVKFNVKDLKDENMKSVKLALYYNGNENQPTTKDIKILAVRAASDWSENKVTWSNKYPELINPDVIAESAQFQATKDAGLAVELDVSKLYESLSGEETEIAFAITANPTHVTLGLCPRREQPAQCIQGAETAGRGGKRTGLHGDL